MTTPPLAVSPSNQDWKTYFDIVKELNNNAGRLGTFLGLVVAACTFSLANGRIHDALATPDTTNESLLYGCLLFIGVVVLGAAYSVLAALHPAVPADWTDPVVWHVLMQQKMRASQRALVQTVSAVGGLSAAWLIAYSGPWPIGGWAFGLSFVFLSILRAILDWWVSRAVGITRASASGWGPPRLR